MDYPKTVPGINLHQNKFTDGDQSQGIPPSLDPAVWANAVTDELIGIITAGGLIPDEATLSQVNTAIDNLINAAVNLRLEKTANLSDLTNASTARSNLGVYSTSETDSAVQARVAISSIINTLTSTAINAPLSAAQGKVLKDTIDQLTAADVGALEATGTALNANALGGLSRSTGAQSNTIVQRNANADIRARQFISEFAEQTVAPAINDTVAFRRGSGDDSIRFATRDAIKSYLGVVSNTGLIASAGWFKDEATGMIMQFGRNIISGNTQSQIPFPIQFPQQCIVVVMSGGNDSNNSPITKTQNHFTTVAAYNGFHVTVSRDWVAIGE